ncbi:hypothetical protein [Microcoleus sp. B5-D4]|uniref:hypothetical protein n=1 Tax=Microcoleus sp. B5-D4 TaxID=2818681 RepID=UPI002FD0A55A
MPVPQRVSWIGEWASCLLQERARCPFHKESVGLGSGHLAWLNNGQDARSTKVMFLIN